MPKHHDVLERARALVEDEPEDEEGQELDFDQQEVVDHRQDRQLDYMSHMATNVDNNQAASVQMSDTEAMHFWSRGRERMLSDVEKCKSLGLDNWIKSQRALHPETTGPRPQVFEASLNRQQRRAYNLVLSYVERQDEQLLFRLEGTAGTGKSHVINAMCARLPSDQYRVCAPTGKAANNVLGRTIHNLLAMVPNRYTALDGLKLRELQDQMRGVKILFIDEFSLLGCRTLSHISNRLKQIFARPDLPFGGIHVMLCGDTKQIPPIKDTPLWNEDYRNVTNPDLKVTAGLDLFGMFKKVVTLTEVVRIYTYMNLIMVVLFLLFKIK